MALSQKVTIVVHKLSNKPTILWKKIEKKQNQRKLPIQDFTTAVKPKQPDHVRFVMISDTHNKTGNYELPDGDVLLHAGDFTSVGRPHEIEHFNEFLGSVKHKYKHIIVICGNHELTFDPFGPPASDHLLNESEKKLNHLEMKKKLTNCQYIEDETVEVMGFKIYGSPWQPEFCGWGYNLPRGVKCLEKWNLIPDDTDILITHGPPLGYGDLCFSKQRAGCAELLSTVQKRVKPIVHLFGHIHEAYGVWSDEVTTYVNASTCTLSYKANNLPVIIDLKASGTIL